MLGTRNVVSGQRYSNKNEGAPTADPIWRQYLKSDALVLQTSIPTFVRLFLCCVILFNIALFIWSNNINIATVRGILDVRQREDDLGELFEFNLAGTVRDMWTAETYALSILVAVFSGAWPYIKLGSMLLAFVLPKSVLSYYHRDEILTWLDILGKWSLLDTFFMVMMMVAFQFDLFVAKDVEINVYVRAEWGFYAFLLATMLSLILGHIVLHLHRNISDKERGVKCTSEIDGGNSKSGESIMNHTFETFMEYQPEKGSFISVVDVSSLLSAQNGCDKWGMKKIKVTAFGKSGVVVFVVSCILTVLFGTFRDTFNFEFKGLTGLLMGDDAVQSYSAASIGTYLPAASRIPQDTGIRWLQASYFIYLLVMPLLFLCCLLALWVLPFRLHAVKKFLAVTEVINAWSALDVFVIALVACLLEIQQFAAFIVGDSCDELNEILEEYFDGVLDGDDKCFDVITTLQKDAWLLYFSSGFLAVAGVILMAICQAAYSQRLAICLKDDSSADILSKYEELVRKPTPEINIVNDYANNCSPTITRRLLSSCLNMLRRLRMIDIGDS